MDNPMNLPLHPMLVHLPMALAVLIPAAAVAVVGAWTRGWWDARTWWLVVALQATLVVSAGLALQSGEAEEERVEHVVAKAAIEAHEEAAQVFAGLATAVLVLAVAAQVFARRDLGRWLAMATVAGSVLVGGAGVAVGHAGGELVWAKGAGTVQVAAPGGAAAAAGPGGAAERGQGHRGHEGGKSDDDDD